MPPRVEKLPLLLRHLMRVGWGGESDRTQKQLAMLLGVSEPELSKWLNEQDHPTREQLCVLRDCEAFGAEVRAVFRAAIDAPVTGCRLGPSAPPRDPCNPPSSFDLYDSRDPLDADRNGVTDLDDARIHSERATAILQRVAKRGWR